MDFYQLSQLGLKARWGKKFSPLKNHIENNHKKMLKEKARIIGFIMGDGSITSDDSSSKGNHHDIRFYPDDITVANLFTQDFQRLYLKKPIFRDLGNYFSLYSSSKPAWEDLRKFGDFSSLNWTFPLSLISKKEKIEWLRAMFDCESYINIKKKNISFQSVSKKGIYSIQNLLREFGIDSKIYIYQRKNKRWNTNYLLFILGRENVYKFAENIGFNHTLKQKKLNIIGRRARMVNGRVSKTRVRKDF